VRKVGKARERLRQESKRAKQARRRARKQNEKTQGEGRGA